MRGDFFLQTLARAAITGLVSYPFVELTRLIFAFTEFYHESGPFSGAQGLELLVIWTGWAVVMALVWRQRW